MKTTVLPSAYNGTIKANPSKSVMQRVIAIAALSSRPTVISNVDKSKDSLAAIGVIKAMGAKVDITEYFIKVIPQNQLVNPIWNVGESGLSARMFAPIAGLFEEEITIVGKGSLLKRPMYSVIEALKQLGLNVEHNDYLLPLKIKGRIKNFDLKLDLSSGSQLLTGLLIAMSRAGKKSIISVKNLKSKPYIDLTSCVLTSFGNRIVNNDYKRFEVNGDSILGRDEFEVEGDWSGVAFHLVGAAISGRIEIAGLNPNSKQSDKAILDVLHMAGARIKIESNTVVVEENKLKSFEFDATDAPDLFPPLAALAVFCEGISKIKGVSRLKHKESDRYSTIKEEFEKIGVKVERQGDFMLVHGGTIPKGAKVHSHNDHRIAMMLGIIGLKSSGEIEIEKSECIAKSYPGFFEDYVVLGGKTK